MSAVDQKLLQQARRVRLLQQQQPAPLAQLDHVVHAQAVRSPTRARPQSPQQQQQRQHHQMHQGHHALHHHHHHHHGDDEADDVLVREFALLDERQRRLRLHESAAAKEMIFREMADEGFQMRERQALASSLTSADSAAAVAAASAAEAKENVADANNRDDSPGDAAADGDDDDAAVTFAEFELFGRRFVVPNAVVPEMVSDVVRRLHDWQQARRDGAAAAAAAAAADSASAPQPSSEWFDDSRALRERLAVLLPPELRGAAASSISSDSLSVNDAPVLLLAELSRLLRSARNCAPHRAQLRALHRRLDVIRTRLASAPDLDSSWTAIDVAQPPPPLPLRESTDDASAAAFVGLIVDVTLAMLEHVELALISEFPRLGMAEERLCHLRHVLERASIEAAHKPLMHHFGAAHAAIDAALAERYADLRSALPGHLGVRPRFWLLDTTRLAPYRLAIGLLRLLPVCETPDAKIRCLLNAQTAVTTEVNEYWRSRLPHLVDDASGGKKAGGGGGGGGGGGCAPTRLPIRLAGDDLLPLLSYIVLQARVPHLYAHLAFAGDFLARRRRGDAEGYCVVLFRSVAEYVSTLDENALERNIEEIRDELDQSAAPPPARNAPPAKPKAAPAPTAAPTAPTVTTTAKSAAATVDFDDAEFSEQILPSVESE